MMNFRNFLYQQILPLITKNRENLNYHNLKTEIFFFQIGCYPSSHNNNHHECPSFLLECQTQNVNVNLVCLDKLYHNFLENQQVRDRIQEFNFPTFIYPNYIQNNEYTCLVEFCHFISNFSCLSIINEYTGIERKQFYDNEHKTKYLYISPSSCQVEKNNKISHPLLLLTVSDKVLADGNLCKLSKYYWKSFPQLENIYEELDFENKKKTEHLKSIIDYYASRVSNIYVRILNLLELEKFLNLRDSNFNKKCNIYYKLQDQLISCFTYDKYEVERLIQEFNDSKYILLEVFLKKKISYLLIAALHFKYQKDVKKIEKYQNYLLFNSTSDILDNLQFLLQ